MVLILGQLSGICSYYYERTGLLLLLVLCICRSSGVITPNPFDQMATASMLGGYHASLRTTPPVSHLYVAAGKSPYVAYYFAMEVSLYQFKLSPCLCLSLPV